MFRRQAIHRNRVAAGTLVLCLLYQMGACPCGCLEHNHWLQALGLSGEHASIDGEQPTRVRIVAKEHDCDGGAAWLFLNTASLSQPFDALRTHSSSDIDQPATVTAVATLGWAFDRGPPVGRCQARLTVSQRLQI